MADNLENVTQSDLQACFNDLKKQSLSYKLGQAHPSNGDEMQNPLNKQFNVMLAKIEDILVKQNEESEDYLKVISMKASIIYEKAKILMSENLLEESQVLLEEALSLIKDQAENPKVAFLHMRIVNHLTYLMSRLGQLERAKKMLEKVIEDQEKCTPEVFSTDDLFLNTKRDDKLSAAKLSRLTTNNMQMLAWIHNRMGNTTENLKLQHEILQKQLDVADGDVLKWVESCYRLGGMFVAVKDWKNALYHLLAAEEVLSPLEVAFIPNPEVHSIQADLARSWIYFGLQLFQYSRQLRIDSVIEELDEQCSSENLLTRKQDKKDCSSYRFSRLHVELLPDIPTCGITNLNEAKNLFNNVQKWIKRAKLFYTLRDYPLQYVNLSLDTSELYRYLAFFEEGIDAQYVVHKRRYDALESLSTLLKEVRPSCFMAVNVELTRELIECQMELMNLNLKKLFIPSSYPSVDINEDTLRRQLNAVSDIHGNLENLRSTLASAETSEAAEDDTTEVVKPEVDIQDVNVPPAGDKIKNELAGKVIEQPSVSNADVSS